MRPSTQSTIRIGRFNEWDDWRLTAKRPSFLLNWQPFFHRESVFKWERERQREREIKKETPTREKKFWQSVRPLFSFHPFFTENCIRQKNGFNKRRKNNFCRGSSSSIACSVTRFGEILPLWQKFTSLWQFFGGLFLIWPNAEPILANLWHNWANNHCCKWPNIGK